MAQRNRIFISVKGIKYVISLSTKVEWHSKTEIQHNIERIRDALETDSPLDNYLTIWLQKIEKNPRAYSVNDLYSKLAKINLVPPRLNSGKPSSFPIKKYLQKYVEEGIASGKHAQTIEKWKYTIKALLRFISPTKDIRDISVLDAKNWYESILKYEYQPNKKYSTSTIGKFVRVIRQFFEEFKDMEIIAKNPFKKIRSSGSSDPERKVYVAKEVAAFFFEKCPDYQSRMLIALARFGGLRIPSDIIMLKFEDINFEKGFFVIHGLKGKSKGSAVVEMEKRICPIFPDLKPIFIDAFKNREEGQEYLLPVCKEWNLPEYAKQRKGKNISSNVRRWLKKLGIDPWAKLFVNLRASLITDLLDKHQQYFVCKWLGNTPNVADKYYRMITQEHILNAAFEGSLENATKISTQNATKNDHFLTDFAAFPSANDAQLGNQKNLYPYTGYELKAGFNSFSEKDMEISSSPTRTRT